MREPSTGITPEELAADPHPILHRLRSEAPVVWVESLGAWMVLSHELCTLVMLDPVTYTVDDPRFSTQQVIGPSMLSLDGARHRRHRDPFAHPFRAGRIAELETEVTAMASGLMERLAGNGITDLRADVAGPLAVAVMTHVLDMDGVAAEDLLGWYQDIVDAVHHVTEGGAVPESGANSFDALKEAVSAHLSTSDLLRSVDDGGSLTVDEIVSNVAVLLFGGIVTSESSTAIAFRQLLVDDGLRQQVAEDRSLVSPLVEEVFRFEPSAAVVDRYATRDVDLGGAAIRHGDLVRVSLSAANRDPAIFTDPDRFDVTRDALGKSLTFARGPHACLGIHLARLEARAAVNAFLDASPRPSPSGGLDPVSGLIFRAPDRVEVTWSGPTGN